MPPFASRSPEQRTAFSNLKARFQGTPGGVRNMLGGVLSSAVPPLDALLSGGFPSGTLVTLEGPLSSGRWSIVARLLAHATRRGLVAVIDDAGSLYPPSLAQAGVRLERVLVVPAHTPLRIARAVDVLVRSRVCRVVVMPATTLRAAIWTRLARLAQRAGTLLVVVASRLADELAMAAGMRLRCAVEHLILSGQDGVCGTFAGYELRAEFCKGNVAVPGTSACMRATLSTFGASLRVRAAERIGREHYAALR